MDFSNLTDDQLLQLIQGAMTEAIKRGSAIAYAANETYLDATEELQIKAKIAAKAAAEAAEQKRREIEQTAQREIAKAERLKNATAQKQQWNFKAAIMHALKQDPLFEEDKDFEFNIWEGKDTRIYIQEGIHKGWEIIYYATGNRYNPPNSIIGLNNKKDKLRLIRFCQEVLKRGNPGLKIKYSTVATIDPTGDWFETLKKTLNLEEPTNV